MVENRGDPANPAAATAVLTMPEAADPDNPEDDPRTRTRT